MLGDELEDFITNCTKICVHCGGQNSCMLFKLAVTQNNELTLETYAFQNLQWHFFFNCILTLFLPFSLSRAGFPEVEIGKKSRPKVLAPLEGKLSSFSIQNKKGNPVRKDIFSCSRVRYRKRLDCVSNLQQFTF